MNKKILLKEFLLLLVTIIWGVAFSFQNIASKYLGPITVTFLRSVISSITIGIFIFISYLIHKKEKKEKETNNKKSLILGGILIGVFCCIGTVTQQAGIGLCGAGLSGFMTSIYILFVPIVGLFFKRKSPWYIWPCLLLACVGLYVMNMMGKSAEETKISSGVIYLIICALGFAFQIVLIDKYSKDTTALWLSLVQFLTMSVLSFPIMLISIHNGTEQFNLELFKNAFWSVLFLGMMSSGVAFTVQIYAQQDVHPVIASMIMSLESVFSFIFGAILLKESHSTYEIIGCVLIFISIISVELLSNIQNLKKVKVK